MIREQQVWDALPPRGFLRSYVEYASECTDANVAYHVASGLACLAQCVPEDYAVPYASPIYSNLYAMVVGDSSKSRKTASINIAMRMLRDAIPEAVGEVPGSQEGLHESLRAQNKQLIVYGEFGEFLAKAEEGYLQPMKTALTGLWDALPIGRATVKQAKGLIEKPRLSLLCAVATDLLERHTEQADWTGGFLARFFTIHAEPEREYATPPIDNYDKRINMTSWLASLHDTQTAIGQCLWLDDKAKQMWADWYEGQRPLREGANRRASAACSRASAIAGKIAMLLAWDIGQARSGQPWRISPIELEPALKLTDLHLESVLELGERVTGSRDMRDRAAVLRAIAEVPTPLGYILRESEMLKRRAQEIIESLMEERAINKVFIGKANTPHYVRTPHAQTLLAQSLLEAKMQAKDPSRSNIVMFPGRSALGEDAVEGIEASAGIEGSDGNEETNQSPPVDTQPAEDVDWSCYEG